MALKIVKITKGFGRKISSSYSYSFWDFPPTILEAEVELDLDKEEDKEKLKEISAKLFQAAKALVNMDIKLTKEKDPELAKSMEKIAEKVENG
jgi:hypothetical protein